jgi:ATP-dependent helicase/nuclease subunit B
MAGSRPNVFTVAPGAPFLDTLARAFLDGRLTPARPPPDAIAIADAVIYLPTRRACRALVPALHQASGRKALLLPRIAPLGGVADDEEAAATPAQGEMPLPAAVSDLERRVVLADIARLWAAEAGRAAGAGIAADPVPRTPGEAVALAADLAVLLDDMLIRGVDAAALARILPQDRPELALNGQINLDFLTHAIERWGGHLAARGLVERVVVRDRQILRAAEALAARPPGAPVIAAGSTGSVPATAALIKAIAERADGAVVLPGLDLDLDEDSWAVLTPDHPQFGMKQLLAEIGIDRGAVTEFSSGDGAAGLRRRLASEVMRPAETAERWAPRLAEIDGHALTAALGATCLIRAHDEHEEARVIALALRETVEHAGMTAALVTPDRSLARRVVAELGRWGLAVNDSAGRPLALTAPGILVRHLLAAAVGGFAPVATLALLKHPLARLGLGAGAARRAARALELAALRGGRPAPGIAGLAAALAEAKATPGRHPVIARLGDRDFAAADELVARLGRATAPLTELLAADGEPPADAVVEALIVAAEAIAEPEPGGVPLLWRGEAGEALATMLAELAAASAHAEPVATADLGLWLDQLMAGRAVRSRAPDGGRIAIWGPLEARLQTADRLIVGGLNEGVWPAETQTDPWLGRHMRAALGLDPPERRIGLAAHDFAQAFGTGEVILTRALKTDGTPTVPSRWIWRMTALLGALGMAGALDTGSRWLAWARGLDHVETATPTDPPRPAPPLAARPHRLSVTQIETLIRDPYAIYARRVLRLEPLDALDQSPAASDQGLIVHSALAELIADNRAAPFGEDALDRLRAIGAELFTRLDAHPGLKAYWWTRFERVARWFVAEEAAHRSPGAVSHTEIEGALDLEIPGLIAPFKLTARADRIDIDAKGRARILDYKTGKPPSPKQMAALMSPQLPLEAAMAAAGAFAAVGPRQVAGLAHIQLTGRGESGTVLEVEAPEALAERAMKFLVARLALYADPATYYASRRSPKYEEFPGPYDHLARVGEWSVALGRRHDG